MKKSLLVLFVLSFSLSCFCQNARPQFTEKDLIAYNKGLRFYEGKEFSLDIFGGVNTDLYTEHSFYGFGTQFYLTENLGFGAFTTLDELSGHLFERISFRGLWRVPIEKHAFYAFGGATRVYHDETAWILNLGPGYEYRIMKHIGLWTEIGFNKDVEDETQDPYASVRGGIRFTF